MRLGLPQTHACTVARLEAYRTGDGRTPEWANSVPQIASRLMVNFPDAEDLARSPARWLQGVKGVEAAVAERQPRNHRIGPGLGQDEHRALTERIADALANEVQLCPPLSQRLTVRKAQRHPLEGELRDMPVEERLAGLVR
jgi:hypothetical protein